MQILSDDITCLLAKLFSFSRVMAKPPQVQCPLQVRAQEVLANIQAVAQAPLPFLPAPQGPQVTLAALAHEAIVENADAGNQNPANQNP